MYVGQLVRLWNGLPHFFRKGAASRPCEGFAYRLQVVNLAPRLNHKEVYEANNQAYYRDRADQCRNHGSYLPCNYFSAETDRVVIEVHQAVLLTCFTRPPAAREISRWVIRYARAGLLPFQPCADCQS